MTSAVPGAHPLSPKRKRWKKSRSPRPQDEEDQVQPNRAKHSQTGPGRAKPRQVQPNRPSHTNTQVSPNQHMGTRRSGSRDPGLRATMGLSHIASALNMGTRRSGSRDPGIQATWAPGVQEAGTQALPPRLRAHPSGPCRVAHATLSLVDPLCRQLRFGPVPGKKDYKGRPERKHQGIRASHHGFVPQPQRAEAAMG